MSRAAQRRAYGGARGEARIELIAHDTTEAGVHLAPAEVSVFLSRVLACCIDIRAVWSVGHAELAQAAPHAGRALLAFADAATLERLRRSDGLHRADIELLVVFDGDRFENAWGRQRSCGSLARWAWRQVAQDVAYYDESRWAEGATGRGAVVRVRRKALLIWPRAPGARFGPAAE